MRKLIITLALVLVASAGAARAQPALPPSTQPADAKALRQLELRANEEFNRGNFAQALPIYKKIAVELRDDPQRVAPILEKVRVCERNLAASAGAAASSNAPPTAEQRKPHEPPKAGEVRELAIQDLGNFDYDAEQGGNIPDDVKRLHGSTVRLKGFMIPMDQAASITQFALVPDLFACCFGQPPQVQHTVVVNAPKGKAVSYYPDEIVVEGKLAVEEKKEEGFIVSIFEIECQSVKPSPK